MTRILVVGGYGLFGALVAERLARSADLEIVIAGRREDAAKAAAGRLALNAAGRVTGTALDATKPDAGLLRALAPSVVVNASGPFQWQDPSLAMAAVAAGAHYVDLADAPAYVTAFGANGALDAAARSAGLLAVTGASSVPAVSAAVVDHHVGRLGTLSSISIGISPGNSVDPGEATTRSLLAGLGLPMTIVRDGRPLKVHGWQGLTLRSWPTLGRRWMSWVDVPDLHLFPRRYPSARDIEFRAGLEVGLMHLGLWTLSWPARIGLIRRLDALAPALLWMKRRLGRLGSNRGGMYVLLEGCTAAGEPTSLHWYLIAGSGHGPYVPATPSVILARRLARGSVPATGAATAIGLVGLDEILAELADLDIVVRLA